MISVVILTKNEEKNIVDCIESVSWCDEILVIDNHSTDRTADLAKRLKAKVITKDLDDNFSEMRNFGLEEAKFEWIFFVDADERVTSTLKKEIEYKIVSHTDATGFRLPRRDMLWGKELIHGDAGTGRFVRLARKDSGKWKGKVHETWEIKGKVEDLSTPLIHYPHQTVDAFLRDINYYTTLRAQELYEKKVSVSWLQILLYPKVKFLYLYFFKRGFLDGIPGLMHAIFMSFHSFLVRSKLWLFYSKKRSK